MQIAFPFSIDGRGRTATATGDDHLRELMQQVLFTAPGERVNRPTFGSGLKQLVFGPLSEEMLTATRFLVQSALQQWLGDLVQVEAVELSSEESVVTVSVTYTVRRNQQRKTATFAGRT